MEKFFDFIINDFDNMSDFEQFLVIEFFWLKVRPFFKNKNSKYLVVETYCEGEKRLFYSIDEILKCYNVNSIDELLNRSNNVVNYYVYEVIKEWSCKNG